MYEYSMFDYRLCFMVSLLVCCIVGEELSNHFGSNTFTRDILYIVPFAFNFGFLWQTYAMVTIYCVVDIINYDIDKFTRYKEGCTIYLFIRYSLLYCGSLLFLINSGVF